jgi:hypothetical protein
VADPTELLERRLRLVLNGTRDSQGLHFFCQTGGSYDERGMTTLQVSGSGWTIVSWQKDEQSALYSVQLTEEDLETLWMILLEYPYWSASVSRREREEGESNIHLRFADQRAGTWYGLQFWSSDMKEFPVLHELMYRLTRLIRLVSEEEIEGLDIEEPDEGVS